MEVTSVMYSPDGRFIRVNAADQRVRVWAVPPADGSRAPEWLIGLATAYAGKKVADDGELVDASAEIAGFEKLRTRVLALPADAPWSAWGKWIFSDPAKRPLAPGFEITLAEAEARGMVIAPVIDDVEKAATPKTDINN